jgi:hypothetical protein
VPWLGEPLDRLIDALEAHAPDCRVVVADANVAWPGKLLWPELVCRAGVVGPAQQLHSNRAVIAARLGAQLVDGSNLPVPLAGGMARDKLVQACWVAWAGEGESTRTNQ